MEHVAVEKGRFHFGLQHFSLKRGSLFLGQVSYRHLFDLLGPYLYFKVRTLSVLGKFAQRMSILSALCMGSET